MSASGSPRRAGIKCKSNMRSPQEGLDSPESKTTRISKENDTDENADLCEQDLSIDGDTNENENTFVEVTICDPLLAYVVFALNSGTQDAIKKAVLGFFTNVQILSAKSKLWSKVGDNIIGKRQNRKSSSVRSEEEANVLDIITALIKLDRADQLPNVVISATDLGCIPRSHPEELNNISLVDRLAKLEHKVSEMKNIICKNSIDIESLTSKFQDITETTDECAMDTHQITVKDTESQPDSYATVVKEAPLSFKSIYHSSPLRNETGRGRGRPTARGRGRGGMSTSMAASNLLAPKEVSRLRGSTASLASRDSEIHNCSNDSEGFRLSSNELRKKYRRENLRKKTIEGKSVVAISGVKGAPEPSRDVFIYRLDKETKTSDLETYIESKGFEIRKLECVSHDEARCKSFKLSVPKSEFEKVLDAEMWPKGISVRQFFPPRSKREDQAPSGNSAK